MADTPPLMPAATSNWNLLGCLIPVIIAGALVFSCSRSDEAADSSRLGAEAVTAVKARLRDPSGASFDQLYSKGGAYCGKVNARNGFGGKSGWQRFVYADGVATLEEDGALFTRRWSTNCA